MNIIKPTVAIAYRTRDTGYGVESGHLVGHWTGERDAWGKRTFKTLKGAYWYLLDDEILAEREFTPAVQEVPTVAADPQRHKLLFAAIADLIENGVNCGLLSLDEAVEWLNELRDTLARGAK